MFNFIHEFLNEAIYVVPAVLISLSLHELAHAYTAYKLGDYTQKERGRITLNPFKHLDPMGTICLIFLKFGWAKPVQVDPYYFKDRKQGMIWTSLAGPMVNLILGFLCVFGFYGLQKLLFTTSLAQIIFSSSVMSEIVHYLITLLSYTAVISIGLGLFNLIPIPPLDGSKLLLGILHEDTYFKVMQYEQVLGGVLVLLLVFGVLDGPLLYAREAMINCFTQVSTMILGM